MQLKLEGNKKMKSPMKISKLLTSILLIFGLIFNLGTAHGDSVAADPIFTPQMDVKSMLQLYQALNGVELGSCFDARTNSFIGGSSTAQVPALKSTNSISVQKGFNNAIGLGSGFNKMHQDYGDWQVSANAKIKVPFFKLSGGYEHSQSHNEVSNHQEIDYYQAVYGYGGVWRISNIEKAPQYFSKNISASTSLAKTFYQCGSLTYRTAYDKIVNAKTDNDYVAAVVDFYSSFGTHVVTGVNYLSIAAVDYNYQFSSQNNTYTHKNSFNVQTTIGGILSNGGASVAGNWLSGTKDDNAGGTFTCTTISIPSGAIGTDIVNTRANTLSSQGLSGVASAGMDAASLTVPTYPAKEIENPDKPPDVINKDTSDAIDKFQPSTFADAAAKVQYVAWKNAQQANGADTSYDAYAAYRKKAQDPIINVSNPNEVINEYANYNNDEDMSLLDSKPKKVNYFADLRAKIFKAKEFLENRKSAKTATLAGATDPDNYFTAGVVLTPWSTIIGIDIPPVSEGNRAFATAEAWVDAKRKFFEYMYFLQETCPAFVNISGMDNSLSAALSQWQNAQVSLENLYADEEDQLDYGDVLKILNDFEQHMKPSAHISSDFYNAYTFLTGDAGLGGNRCLLDIINAAPYGFVMSAANPNVWLKAKFTNGSNYYQQSLVFEENDSIMIADIMKSNSTTGVQRWFPILVKDPNGTIGFIFLGVTTVYDQWALLVNSTNGNVPNAAPSLMTFGFGLPTPRSAAFGIQGSFTNSNFSNNFPSGNPWTVFQKLAIGGYDSDGYINQVFIYANNTINNSGFSYERDKNPLVPFWGNIDVPTSGYSGVNLTPVNGTFVTDPNMTTYMSPMITPINNTIVKGYLNYNASLPPIRTATDMENLMAGYVF